MSTCDGEIVIKCPMQLHFCHLACFSDQRKVSLITPANLMAYNFYMQFLLFARDHTRRCSRPYTRMVASKRTLSRSLSIVILEQTIISQAMRNEFSIFNQKLPSDKKVIPYSPPSVQFPWFIHPQQWHNTLIINREKEIQLPYLISPTKKPARGWWQVFKHPSRRAL